MEDQRAGMPRKLRIGIMVNSMITTLWVAKIVKQIQGSDFAEIVLVVENASPAPPKKPLRKRLKTYWTHSLFERYRQWDRERHKDERNAFAESDLTGFLNARKVLKVVPIHKGFVDRFSEEDVARINEAKLDVMFRFGFGIIRGKILSCARYGIWSFHHGDNREYRGAPPGFWEMYEKNPVTGSILQVLTEALDGGRVIYRSLSATDFGSLYRTLNPMYWKTSEFAIRRLRDLYQYGWSYIESLEEYNEEYSYKKELYKTPTTPIMLKFLARLATQKIYQRIRAFFLGNRAQWFMALRKRPAGESPVKTPRGFTVIPCDRGRFYADPFLVKKDGRTYIFFEDFAFDKDRASISFAEIQSDGRIGSSRTALDTGAHLSYPFLFEHDGTVYMIPETKARKTIELYRATEFPHRWELVREIASNVTAVDSTIHSHAGRLWLFVNMAVPGASTFDELHLFYSDSLTGEWAPHQRNPVVSDVRRARPAGKLFEEGGRLIRPSQDCSERYGGALNFNEVEILSETEYRERLIGRIEPDWCPGSICTHTYNATDEYEVLDGMRLIR